MVLLFSLLPAASRITLRSMWHTSRAVWVSWATCMLSLPTTLMQSEHLQQHTLAYTLTGLGRLGSVVFRGGVFTQTVQQNKPLLVLWTTTLWSPADTRGNFTILFYLWQCRYIRLYTASLKWLSQTHISKAARYLLVSCAKTLTHPVFMFCIYLFWLAVYSYVMLFGYLQLPHY